MSFTRAIKYYSLEYPAYFYAAILGLSGPLIVLTVPPIKRNFFGYTHMNAIPTSYPLPKRGRGTSPAGYED